MEGLEAIDKKSDDKREDEGKDERERVDMEDVIDEFDFVEGHDAHMERDAGEEPYSHADSD